MGEKWKEGKKVVLIYPVVRSTLWRASERANDVDDDDDDDDDNDAEWDAICRPLEFVDG